MSKYYLSIKQCKFYKQKLPECDMRPFELKSSVHNLYNVLSQYGDRSKSSYTVAASEL